MLSMLRKMFLIAFKESLYDFQPAMIDSANARKKKKLVEIFRNLVEFPYVEKRPQLTWNVSKPSKFFDFQF